MVYRIYVGGLNASIEKRDLQELFERYGQPLIWVARSPPGFAFVEIQDKRDAEDSIKDLDGTEFRGVRLKLEFAKDSSSRPRGPVDRTFADARSRASYQDRYNGYDDRYDDPYGDRDRDRYSSSSRSDDRYSSSSSRYDDRDRYSSSSRYDDRRYPATTYHDERRGAAFGGELKCFNCNQMGHYARDCPKEKNMGECYTCGKPGHQSRDCPDKLGGGGGSSSSSSRRDSRRSRSPRSHRNEERQDQRIGGQRERALEAGPRNTPSPLLRWTLHMFVMPVLSPRRSRSRSPGDKRRSASPRRESNGDASSAH